MDSDNESISLERMEPAYVNAHIMSHLLDGVRVRVPCRLVSKDDISAQARTSDNFSITVLTLTALSQTTDGKIKLVEWPSEYVVVDGILYDGGGIIAALSITPIGPCDMNFVQDLIEFAHEPEWLKTGGSMYQISPFESGRPSHKPGLLQKLLSGSV